MRRRLLIQAAAAAFFALAPASRAIAQVGGIGVGADPFSFYYGYYLPHQSYIAAQPRPLDAINQVVANRQYSAQTDRAALYDPISPYGDEDADPLRPYAPGRGGDRSARPTSPNAMAFGSPGSSTIMGNGPATYYSRTARYFPSLKPARGPNKNVAVVRGVRGGGGMPSMPGMSGIAGPR